MHLSLGVQSRHHARAVLGGHLRHVGRALLGAPRSGYVISICAPATGGVGGSWREVGILGPEEGSRCHAVEAAAIQIVHLTLVRIGPRVSLDLYQRSVWTPSGILKPDYTSVVDDREIIAHFIPGRFILRNINSVVDLTELEKKCQNMLFKLWLSFKLFSSLGHCYMWDSCML